MRFYNMEPLCDKPFKFYDVQKLFSLAYEDGKKRRSLEYAIDFLKIEKDIPFHRAFSDAYYTAKVFQKIANSEILKYVSFDTYHIPKTRKEEIKTLFPGYYKYISRGFEAKSEIMTDREVSSTKCYLCHKNLKKTFRWYTPNGKNYYSISKCDVHGYINYKVRLKKSEFGLHYAIKTSKFITEDKMRKLQEEWNKEKEVKKIKAKNVKKPNH